ncbi:TolB family protein [Flavobacterium sp. XGLA_31]|uniref:TolB family protein n=1 Tax=Flavobacterium sp. XGLA_31 TaxID=3447666 RepID=UPI003F35F0F1
MKNLLKSTLYLAVFALAGILFQISCSNSDNQSLSTASQNKVIYTSTSSGTQTIWTCNYDGTNLTQIPITLPSNLHFSVSPSNADARLSPDGQKIFFKAYNDTSSETEIYSCDITGTNIQLVASPNNSAVLTYHVN